MQGAAIHMTCASEDVKLKDDGVVGDMKKNQKDPSDPAFVQANVYEYDVVAGGEKIACDRRMPRKNPVKYARLDDKVRDALPDTAFEISIPILDGVLDIERVQRCTVSKGLGTIVVSRATLCAMTRGISNPVGSLIPVFGQIRCFTKFDENSTFAKNCAPIADDHAFAFCPVVLATTGESGGDQGEIVMQGVVVSNKAVNGKLGDARRWTIGRNPVFEETVCIVLVTHVYDPPISYAALGPHGTKKHGSVYKIQKTPGRNAYESTFLWDEFMHTRGEERGCGVSSFGFTDTKQSGKDVVRHMFPWTICHAASVLGEFRRHGDLRRFLLETPMTLAGKRAAARKECPSGIDVRRFLLAELVLKCTPLESLLDGRVPTFGFRAPCIDELKKRMTTLKNDHDRGSGRSPAM